MIELKNEWLTAVVNPLGAELQKLTGSNGLEYLWNGNSAYWGKFSPVLFPVVGTLVGNRYQYKGQWYSLPRHGFAREQIFALSQYTPAEATFTLTQTPQSLQVYPFAFTLQLQYTLVKDTLQVVYNVLNTGEETLYFSIGGHPAFAVPNLPNTTYTDYYLAFNQPEPLHRYLLQDGLLRREAVPLTAPGGQLPLHPDLFAQDALVLKHLQSTQVSLLCRKHPHGIDFNFQGFPYLGLWAAPQAPFVCIEPWCGHADEVAHNGDITAKAGIEMLAPGMAWQRSWWVQCF